MKHQKSEIISLMLMQGGGFVSAIALAWQHADKENKAILEKAFVKYFYEYDRMITISENKKNAK